MQPTTEGATTLLPPPTNLTRGPRAPGAREKGQPFYNPGMALNRDLSVLLVEAFARHKGREIDVADALAGTGARSLRMVREVAAPIVVHANDAQPEAVAAIRRTAQSNGIADTEAGPGVAGDAPALGEGAGLARHDPTVPPPGAASPARGRLRIRQGDAHAFLSERRFDVVDLDPCGSPMPFLDAAVRATRHAGLVCATATDTGALAGAFPRALRRRYDAHHGLHAEPWRAEVGLRILAGAVVRSAARFDRVATPVLAVAHGHWMRVVARVEDGKRDADAALKRMANAHMEDGVPRLRPVGATEGAWAGPLWGGPLHDAQLVAGMQAARVGKSLARGDEVDALLAILAQECDAAPFWIVPDRFQKRLGPPPRRDLLIDRLRAAGWKAARSHIDPQGVRTDATAETLAKVWQER